MDKPDRFHNHAQNLKTTDTVTWQVICADGTQREKDEEVITEHFTEVSVNGMPAFRLSCTPEHLTELVVGRLYTEGIITAAEDIKSLFICGEGNIVEVVLNDNAEFKPYTGHEPTCCTGNKQYMGRVRELLHLPETDVDRKAVFELAGKFVEDGKLHRTTGGTHSCYIRFEDGTTESFEDIGRHNALDKAVGHMLLEGKNPAGTMVFTTGRIAADMAEKTIAAGIPVLVSKAVPTTKAISLARKYGLRIICRAWPDSYCELK